MCNLCWICSLIMSDIKCILIISTLSLFNLLLSPLLSKFLLFKYLLLCFWDPLSLTRITCVVMGLEPSEHLSECTVTNIHFIWEGLGPMGPLQYTTDRLLVESVLWKVHWRHPQLLWGYDYIGSAIPKSQYS